MQNTLNFINLFNYKLQLEKLVIGIEEPIFIKGIGVVQAKVDSGNGAYNVLHGEDFYYQGSTVVFTTYDENEQPHKISKKIQDTITINIGAGHTEERPIVLLDVKFANDEYLNVPFTIGNRSNNKNKVLLGKEFLTKELNALIDVSAENISDKDIQIDVPLHEGLITKDKDTGESSTLKKGWQKAKGIGSAAAAVFNFLGSTGTITQGIRELKDNLKNAKNIMNAYQKSDKSIIMKALHEQIVGDLQKPEDVMRNPEIFKILDFTGEDYAKNNKNANEKEYIKALKTKRKDSYPIYYLAIFDGSKLNEAKQLLANEYSAFNGDFSSIMKDINNKFNLTSGKAVAKKIIEVFKREKIQASFVFVEGKGTERKATIIESTLGDNDERLIRNFLNSPVSSYTATLIMPSTHTPTTI